MKAFDMHDDMGTNLYHRFLNGEKDVFKKYHLDDLKKGEVEGASSEVMNHMQICRR